jgi:L-aminopeptidase/D-esterase-like protein
MGSTQIKELGEIETPILLTSTLGVPRTADYLMDYMLALPGNESVGSINPVIGETNDGFLNDIRGRHILKMMFSRQSKMQTAARTRRFNRRWHRNCRFRI